MKFRTHKTNRVIAILLTITLIFGVVFCTTGCNDNSNNNKVADIRTQALQTVANSITEATFGVDDWSIFALLVADYDAQDLYDAYYNSLVESIKSEDLANTQEYTNFSKAVILLSAMGKNAQDVDGYDLLQKLYDVENVATQGVNGIAYALIALDMYGSQSEVKQEYVQKLLATQNADGGFTYAEGCESNADMTAIVLKALAPHQDNSDVKVAIDNAITALINMQDDNGDFYNVKEGDWSVANCCSTSEVIIALCTLGINPDTDNRFVAENGSAIDALLKYYNSDNHTFNYMIGDDEPSAYALISAIQAIEAYNKLCNNQSTIYTYIK